MQDVVIGRPCRRARLLEDTPTPLRAAIAARAQARRQKLGKRWTTALGCIGLSTGGRAHCAADDRASTPSSATEVTSRRGCKKSVSREDRLSEPTWADLNTDHRNSNSSIQKCQGRRHPVALSHHRKGEDMTDIVVGKRRVSHVEQELAPIRALRGAYLPAQGEFVAGWPRGGSGRCST